MPKYVIEREVPGAGSMSSQDLQDLSRNSRNVLTDMGPQIQWVQSQVTGEEMIRQHAEQGGFPANRVSEVRSIIDPTTAEG